ncbi:MAG: glycoside hydrolase family 43 protein [Planctomycetota bacterium]
MRSSIASLALCLLVPAFAAAQDTFTNPVTLVDAADPGVLRVGDTYYMVTTSGWDPNGFPIRTSKDLRTWTEAGHVFPQASRPAWAVTDYWAPELHKVGSQYVCYYTARDASGRLCISSASAPSPTGPFTDIGHPLIRNEHVGSIDPAYFEDADGTRYLYWKSDGNDVGEPSRIWVQKLGPDGLSLTGEPTALIQNDQPWETSCVEGPAVVKKDGYYYLFYSGNMFDNPGYSVGVARSTSPMGPFEKHPGGPILHQGNDFTGTGHNSLVTDPEGNTFIVYHAYAGTQVVGPRVALVDRVRWENGWPAVNDGMPGTTFVGPAKDPGLVPPPAPRPEPRPDPEPGPKPTPPPIEKPYHPGFWERIGDWVHDRFDDVVARCRGLLRTLDRLGR